MNVFVIFMLVFKFFPLYKIKKIRQTVFFFYPKTVRFQIDRSGKITDFFLFPIGNLWKGLNLDGYETKLFFSDNSV